MASRGRQKAQWQLCRESVKRRELLVSEVTYHIGDRGGSQIGWVLRIKYCGFDENVATQLERFLGLGEIEGGIRSRVSDDLPHCIAGRESSDHSALASQPYEMRPNTIPLLRLSTPLNTTNVVDLLPRPPITDGRSEWVCTLYSPRPPTCTCTCGSCA